MTQASATYSVSSTAAAHAMPAGLVIAQLQEHDHNGAPLFCIAHWQLSPGVHWLYGASGSGKTRLLKRLAQADCAGDAQLSWQAGESAEAAPRALHAADVFYADPHSAQWDAMTMHAVHAQLRAPSKQARCGLSSASAARSHADLIEGFGLTPHLDKPMFMLSTGTRRKVFLMAALQASQPLILLDEPSAALDVRSIRCLQYALAVRKRLAGQVLLIATAIEPSDPHALRLASPP